MSRGWKKWGSGYDPNHTGKQQRPKSDEEIRREEQYQVGGCGDPSCATCNPETAIRIARGEMRMPGSPPPNVRTVTVDLGRNMGVFSGDYRELERMLLNRMGSSGPATPKADPDSPPASYTQAREEVEGYICVAPEQAFDDIVGNEGALELLRDSIESPIKHKELYEKYGMKMPKGALLSGPPGCGKTMFARAAASEMKRLYASKKGVEFLSLSGGEIQTMYVGETEKIIKSLFTYAREYKAWHGHPLLIFIDEAEVILPDRTGRVRRVAPWEESQVATFLAEMDGIQESGAFVMLASNRPEVIDQAVLRDGRCDFKIIVEKPNQEAIKKIVEKNFANSFMKDSVDQLVFAAVESLYDPHKIMVEFHFLKAEMEEEGMKFDDVAQKHFLFEHILSGAMAASIPGRAARHAFSRDKKSGKVTGITVADVVASANDLFEENKGLEHSFALEKFKQEFYDEVKEGLHDKQRKRRMN